MCEAATDIVQFSLALWESALDAIVVVDPQGRVKLVNAMTEHVFGYARRDLVGQPVELLIPQRYHEAHRQHRKRYSQAPRARPMGAEFELFGLRQDGSEFPAEISLSPVETKRGTYVLSAVRDITERRQAQEALRQSEERFALAVRGTDAGIWDWNLLTNRVYFSPRWKSMLGHREEEIGDGMAEWECSLHDEDRDIATMTFRDYLQGRIDRYESEHRLRCKNGSYCWVLARGALVRDTTGRPYRMVGSNIDITSRKQSELTLARRESQLVAAAEIQQSLQPKDTVVVPGFSVAGRCYPAEFAAGDHFEFLRLRDGSLLIVLADVSGHGVGPAILTAAFHAQIEALAASYSEPVDIVSRINASLHQKTAGDRFVTLIVARLDPESGVLEYVNAGHPAGVVLDETGNVKYRLEQSNLPLGIDKEAEFHAGPPVRLADQDLLFLFTDGLIESQSAGSPPFGIERVVRIVAENRHEHPKEIIDALRQAIRQHLGSRELDDDVTMVAVKRQET